MLQNTIKSEDLSYHSKLSKLLSENCKWNLSTKESIELYKCLLWYESLSSKLKSHIIEDIKVSTPENKPSKKK